MNADDSRTASPEPRDSVGSTAPEVIAAASETATWGSYRRRKELYIKSNRAVRTGAGILVVLLLIGGLVWAFKIASLFDRPDLVCAECPWAWFRWTQAALGVAGLGMTVVVVSYVVYFYRSGRIWRHRRGVLMILGITAAAWALLVILAFAIQRMLA